MSYREKKDNETWNQYHINIFRESREVNYISFCNNYFADEKRTLEYKEGINKEKEDLKLNEVEKKEVCEDKVTFAKKPKRFLF